MIYLDNSATTRPRTEVIEAVRNAMEEGWYNPSSVYRPSMDVQKGMEDVRKACLTAVHARNGKVIFTSGGTEADNLALMGSLKRTRKTGKVLLFSLDHPAVLSCAEEMTRMGQQVIRIPCDTQGVADLSKLEEMMDPDVLLISVMQVNNEVGSVQPLERIMEMKKRLCPDAWVHVDGVQGFLRCPIDFDRLGIDSYAFSGHKIHALKGTGALICRKDAKIAPILYGGGQENELRSGTENTVGITALGTAINAWQPESIEHMHALKLRLWNGIRETIPEAELNGPDPEGADAAPHILNVSFQPVRSQTMLFALEGDGIYVSAGSACASRKQKISPVLKAMNVTTARADSALRFSLSPFTTEADIDLTVKKLGEHYNELKKYVRR